MGKRSFDRLGNGSVRKIGDTNDGQSKIYLQRDHRQDGFDDAAVDAQEKQEQQQSDAELNIIVFRGNGSSFLADTKRQLTNIKRKNLSENEMLAELGILLSDKVSSYIHEVADLDSDNTTSINQITQVIFDDMTADYVESFEDIFEAMSEYTDVVWEIESLHNNKYWMLDIASAKENTFDSWRLTSFDDQKNNFSNFDDMKILAVDFRYDANSDPFDADKFEPYANSETIELNKTIRENYEIIQIEKQIQNLEIGQKDDKGRFVSSYDKGDYGDPIAISDNEKRIFEAKTFEDPQEALVYYSELNKSLESINGSIMQYAMDKIFLVNAGADFTPSQSHVDSANSLHRIILQRFEADPNTIEFQHSAKEHMAEIIEMLEADYIIPNIEELEYDIILGFEETDEGYIYPQYIWKQNGEIINGIQVERNIRSVLSSAVRRSDPNIPPPSSGGGGRGQLRRTTVFKDKPQLRGDISGDLPNIGRLNQPKLRSNIEDAVFVSEVEQEDILAILRQNLAEIETEPVKERSPIIQQNLVTQKTKRKVFDPRSKEPTIDVSQLDKNLNEFKKAKPPRKRRKVKPIEFAKRTKTTRRSVKEDAEKL